MTEGSAVEEVDGEGILLLFAGDSVWTPHSMYDLAVVEDILWKREWEEGPRSEGQRVEHGCCWSRREPAELEFDCKGCTPSQL